MSGMLFSIDGFIERLSSADVGLGSIGPVNFTQIDLTQPEPDKVERTSNMLSSYGSALDVALFEKPTEIEVGWDDIDPDLLSLCLRGTVASYTQSAQTDKSASVVVKHDRWVGLESGDITALTVTGKVEGTDYLLHADGGLFKALSTGSIVDGATVSYTYSCAARSGKRVKAGADKSSIICRIHGPGANKFTGESGYLDIPRAVLFPTQTLSFATKTAMSFSLKGTVTLKAGLDYEWRFDTYSVS